MRRAPREEGQKGERGQAEEKTGRILSNLFPRSPHQRLCLTARRLPLQRAHRALCVAHARLVVSPGAMVGQRALLLVTLLLPELLFSEAAKILTGTLLGECLAKQFSDKCVVGTRARAQANSP